MNIDNRIDGKRARSRAARLSLGVGFGMLALLLAQRMAFSSENAVPIAPPALDEPVPAASAHEETAVFAGGCFRGVQGVFQHVRGVKQAVSGYSGGQRDTAHYETVSGGATGHAESVQVTFDPAQVTYGQLLQVYFSVIHDPTQLDRQGPDSGPQYRSAVFPLNDTQRRVAQSYIAQLDKAHDFPAPIVTKLEPFKGFYPAEFYHQNYLTEHPNSAYIALNDIPKVANLKRLFPGLYRDKPVLVQVAR
ncbi:MAG: Peptide-methionine (S)-S-oxide reductase MsrA (EC [uncultured Paraburkholderia sp.]|nr:MAG: Peptide-methionine (S)-S-oxide reductase MsrA (EC [uncultured Paraburkholderia sp.]CAH2784710.1 MAG: Peptide-methionine (S)-S-oxide reductase MsrA (EC [uncultured Paraburkholderia sp.]CAH2918254.1 MAG: Peptide-methionine (S)-S-oxide reductase MsrA (EC [uncultured Paraburkholderia sp.]CAH2919388.1 MAG: Peptide-methionine (S)-S-oxide reductase MsrA (EC [uncultured Paraburkholderia sp.]